MPKPKKNQKEKFVPYARGFKPPTKKTQQQALGFEAGNELPLEYTTGECSQGLPFFHDISKPKSIDDWLAQYNEDGQTYKLFLKECPWLSSRKRKYMSQTFKANHEHLRDKYPDGKIYLVAVGDFPSQTSVAFEDLVDFAERYLGIPVCILPAINMKGKNGQLFWVENVNEHQDLSHNRRSTRVKYHEINTRFNHETKHLQLKMDSTLLKMKAILPKDAICLIGLTMYDLYESEPDLFVAGLAAGNHRVAMFSFYRYDPCLTFSGEHWYEIHEDPATMPNEERRRVILHRSCKLLVHEINHLLGLDHCVFYDCCMNGSGHLDEDYRQPIHLCPVDLRKLQTLVGFNVVQRYQKLAEFYQKHHLIKEFKWVTDRIHYIQQTVDKN